MYQLFVRMLGTNNLPDCSNMCHESSGWAMGESIGIGKGTVKLEDFGLADCILIIGQNPGTNHPRMLSALRAARKNGAEIISINPLPEAGLMAFSHPQHPTEMLNPVQLTTQFLPVKINGDVALLKGIMKALFEYEAAAPGQGFRPRVYHRAYGGFRRVSVAVARRIVEKRSSKCRAFRAAKLRKRRPSSRAPSASSRAGRWV